MSTSRPRTVRIGITLGDVNGIGPEVSLKAVLGRRWPAGVQFLLIGDERIAAEQARRLRLRTPATGSRVTVWNPTPSRRLSWRPGRPRPDAARSAAEWICAAVTHCRAGVLDAMVTAPISKEGFHAAGIRFPGHTEMLAELTGARRFAMMLLGGPLRVVLATRHIPLRQVSAKLTRAGLVEAIRLTGEALPWLGAEGNRIGVCGLNPHAGEGGDLGDEEITTIAPAIRAARRAGFNAIGPVPADTIFHHAGRGAYDAVVAMYHDQGLGPLKMIGFETGVNVTLGLPIVRTSPDHGTAFDIAGRNKANPSSMVEAIRLAIVLARRRNPWSKRE
jgi:4-hydroxythreonine-4-phosphate dehydrogenase